MENQPKKLIADIIDRVNELILKKEHVIVAIDGRCASGKTTLATELQKIFNCNIIHADSFFLRPEQRTKERYSTPGENIDHERLLSEVILPLSEGKEFYYSTFNCATQTLDTKIKVKPSYVTVIEGSYCCHSSLRDFYDLKIFLDIDEKTQRERILIRNKDSYRDFFDKWIPLEELYIKSLLIKEIFDIHS